MKVNHASLRFIGDLKDFLKSRDNFVGVDFKGRQSAKHIIESLGVPHTEISQILINNQPVSLSQILVDQDYVEVFPWSSGDNFIIKHQIEPAFILDNHLGKLAVFLRILGMDAYYRNDLQDDEIVRYLTDHEKILLTRDRRLLMRREIRWGYCVRNDDPKEQLIEVLDRFSLHDRINPMNRCLLCNHELRPIEKLSIIHRLEPLTKLYYEEFHICPHCDQIYWKGTHYQNMLKFIHEIRK